MKIAFAAGIAAVLLGLVAAAIFVRGGLYDVAATSQHTGPMYSLLRTVMRYSVERQARDIEAPPIDAAAQDRGADVYAANCLSCHGAPGVAPADFATSMQPLPGPLVDAPRHWLARELYWITRNGIKMSGMPAWQYRLADEDIWALVAFITRLPRLSPEEFAALRPTGRESIAATPPGATAQDTAPDPERGRQALHQHACNSCHVIPGVTGADVHVGPPLAGIASRKLIAGALPNEPAQMVRWLRDPKSIDPLTAMPAMDVAEGDARDMAAYLATLRHD